MLVRDLMVQPPTVVHRDASLGEVARAMLASRTACLAVVDDRGELCGIITEDDFVPEESLLPFSTERLPRVFAEWVSRRDAASVYRAARSLKAKDVMKPAMFSVADDAPVEEALFRMRSCRCIPVVRKNVPIGTLSPHEVLQMME